MTETTEHTGQAQELVTRGRWARLSPRPTVFVEGAERLGDIVHDHERHAYDAGHLRVLMTGPPPWAGIGGARAWAGGVLPAGWVAEPGGHYMHGAHPVLRLVHEPTGSRIEVCRAAQWFGDGDYSPELAREAWHDLGRRIAGKFSGGVLLSTPASTGRDLLLRSLGDHEYPVADDELQQLIRSTSGQGRIELFPQHAYGRRAGHGLGRLVEYDGRMMYAGCVNELPTGEARWEWCRGADIGDDFLGHTRARYRVDFTVPRTWAHVGLLGVMDDGPAGWTWPATPGATGSTWCDGVELAIAIEQGWDVRIRERVYWPERGRPLDTWARKLVECVPTSGPRELRPLVRAGVRGIVLHGIGALHGRGYRVSRTSSSPIDVPRGVDAVYYDDAAGLYSWSEDRGQRWPELAHPEWTAAVWARARARLLDCPTGTGRRRAGMLHVDPSTIVACRTDAVYLTADPGWPDDGRVGRLTRRRSGLTLAPWPASHRELLAVRSTIGAADESDGLSSTGDDDPMVGA